MSKAVLISIQPKWCELIANGKKTVEVRKTKPKLETPFKCYIYMTAGDAVYPVTINGAPYTCSNVGGKVVIGEFVCNKVEEFAANCKTTHLIQTEQLAHSACIPMDKLVVYGYNSPRLYAWHISNLKIYDTQKRLSEFWNVKCSNKKGCSECYIKPNCITHITRPPQSWCYVEELS